MSEASKNTFPIVVVEDRYSGVYSGYRWLAFPQFDTNINYTLDIYDGVWGDDVSAAGWAYQNEGKYWGGDTPNEAVENLKKYYPDPQPGRE